MQRELTDQTFPHEALPLSVEEISALMQRLRPWPTSIALAVSGGPDSMAMAFTLKRWADEHHIKLAAFIVDHALRPESGQEALRTQQSLATLGFPCHILRWDHPPITTGLHVAARQARYELLANACRHNHIQHLITAHQQEDQAETILMRFAKGSGIDGLAGMATTSAMNDLILWRPFLSVPKARMIATCVAAHISFVTDSSNLSERFARGRLRKIMPLLADEGLTVARLIDMGQRAASVKDALEQTTNALLRLATTRDIAGTVSGDVTALQSAPRAIAERALTKCLLHVHPEDYQPEHTALSSLLDTVLSESDMAPRTLHGCIISRNRERFSITRELSSIRKSAIEAGQSILWDKVWRVIIDPIDDTKDYHVRPLGLPTHILLDQVAPGLAKQVPLARARSCMPSLWQGDRLVCGPSITGSALPQTALKAERAGSWPP